MKYEKANAEVVCFGKVNFFMTGSPAIPSSAEEALQTACGGYNGGGANNFSCSSFGPFNEANPPYQNAQVEVAGGIYVFDYVGNHWKCHKNH